MEHNFFVHFYAMSISYPLLVCFRFTFCVFYSNFSVCFQSICYPFFYHCPLLLIHLKVNCAHFCLQTTKNINLDIEIAWIFSVKFTREEMLSLSTLSLFFSHLGPVFVSNFQFFARINVQFLILIQNSSKTAKSRGIKTEKHVEPIGLTRSTPAGLCFTCIQGKILYVPDLTQFSNAFTDF